MQECVQVHSILFFTIGDGVAVVSPDGLHKLLWLRCGLPLALPLRKHLQTPPLISDYTLESKPFQFKKSQLAVWKDIGKTSDQFLAMWSDMIVGSRPWRLIWNMSIYTISAVNRLKCLNCTRTIILMNLKFLSLMAHVISPMFNTKLPKVQHGKTTLL